MTADSNPGPGSTDDEVQRIRDAFREDFLQSREAAELLTEADETVRLLAEQAKRAGRSIDRSAEWNRLVTDALTRDREVGGDVSSQIDAAAARTQTGVQVASKTLEESLVAARGALSAEFPGAQLRVDSKTDAWGAWLVITWTDGPTVARVKETADRFKGVKETPDGPARWAFYGISPFRRLSPGARAWAEKQWNSAGVTRNPSDPETVVGVPEGAETMIVAGLEVPAVGGAAMERYVNELLALISF
ncbi:hypothetical protein [Microbacterium enclense]|uniref:hypothetical protein n=1 Tax=Microbacterium enclense TaxID=993073 RepID=UPI003F7F41A4